jgi:hypothetical protein
VIAETMILEDGTEITPIHFLVIVPHGRSRMACMPGLTDFASAKYRAMPWMRSEEPRSVSCPLCQLTAEFIAAKDKSVNARCEWRGK